MLSLLEAAEDALTAMAHAERKAIDLRLQMSPDEDGVSFWAAVAKLYAWDQAKPVEVPEECAF
ncbi:hypothetical protein IPV08_09205 [Methylobacterium sp. SD274]|uniref:hypothetical protein n=1 Tax=Methylobacterium sp. SD274 TaxID=2782009 RepID=UPI001A95AC63|nr:hypothetical protein [Methylobacterium sp. SD274]MBO1020142.1 hypothetical protein [Methylobacterium sp. SD274]